MKDYTKYVFKMTMWLMLMFLLIVNIFAVPSIVYLKMKTKSSSTDVEIVVMMVAFFTLVLCLPVAAMCACFLQQTKENYFNKLKEDKEVTTNPPQPGSLWQVIEPHEIRIQYKLPKTQNNLSQEESQRIHDYLTQQTTKMCEQLIKTVSKVPPPLPPDPELIKNWSKNR